MTTPERSYLVCSTQRSGSTLLCELLKETQVAGRPDEYFEAIHDTGRPPHPGDYLEGLPRTGVGIRDDPDPTPAPWYSSLEGIDDYRDHLTRTFAVGTTPNGVFGAKLMFNQIPELRALTEGLPEYGERDDAKLLERLFGGSAALRYIWVSRNDKVRQAVSLWKALQTRSWRFDDGQRRTVELQYRFAAIDHLVRRLEAQDGGWRAFFSAHGIEPLAISYEDDLERDPAATVVSVLRWIGVSAPAGWNPGQPIDRQSDALSDAWVAAYHGDRAHDSAPPAPSKTG